MKDFSHLEEKIGERFNDKKILKQAFTHRSYINEHPHLNLCHNERLEFLGDAVLELVATKYLFEKFPDKPEGELTAYRAALVNTVGLAEVSRKLGLNDFLLLSRGEMKDTGRAREYILANTLEALIGALYLDKGYATADAFITNHILSRLDVVLEKRLWQDPKSRFQERSQEAVGITPSYSVIKEAGPDHDKVFTIGVFLGESLIAEGQGNSKQAAEQEAAEHALEEKGWN